MYTITKTIIGVVLVSLAAALAIANIQLLARVDQNVKTIAEQRKMIAERDATIESWAQALKMANDSLAAAKSQMEEASASMRADTATMTKATQRLAYQKGQIEALTALLDGCTDAALEHRREHHAPN